MFFGLQLLLHTLCFCFNVFLVFPAVECLNSTVQSNVFADFDTGVSFSDLLAESVKFLSAH